MANIKKDTRDTKLLNRKMEVLVDKTFRELFNEYHNQAKYLSGIYRINWMIPLYFYVKERKQRIFYNRVLGITTRDVIGALGLREYDLSMFKKTNLPYMLLKVHPNSITHLCKVNTFNYFNASSVVKYQLNDMGKQFALMLIKILDEHSKIVNIKSFTERLKESEASLLQRKNVAINQQVIEPWEGEDVSDSN